MHESEANTCHCCEGVSVQTPSPIDNRPGLAAIAYRVGTHPQFRQSLLARLSLSGEPSLEPLTTRDDSDFTIGLLDAWSVVADVLTFYQERIANESYLHTATERFSILEMARLIGYELNPGVAASTYLAFTLDDTQGALTLVPGNSAAAALQEGLPPISIEQGIKVQTIPGPGEKAQTFETIGSIEARANWNAIKPRLSIPQTPLNKGAIVFNGTTINLKEGDVLLIRENGVSEIRKVLKIKIDTELKTTRAELIANPVLPTYLRPTFTFTGVFTAFLMPQLSVLTQGVVNNLGSRTWREADVSALIATNRWSVHEVTQSLNTRIAAPQPAGTQVFVLRKKASAFGYNAPKKIRFNSDGVPVQPTAWDEWTHVESEGKLFLDNAYDEILPGSELVIQNPVNASKTLAFYQVETANVSSRTEYGISSKTTAISLTTSDDWWGSGTTLAALRSVTVYAQSELLELAELPIEDLIQGDTITLDRYYAGLKVAQPVILTGERADLNGVLASEVMILADVTIIDGLTVLTFLKSLTYQYKPRTVSINANVAEATHGETVQEVLGSGDASVPFQQFKLRQPPLTYRSASTPSGAQTTLEIRVNDLLWQEVDYFLDHEPHERIYITRQDNEGVTTVIFGDGITGARLPTGPENIKAKYRKGIGAAGNVKANQISQLLTQPLGVKAAVNPVAATGAEDPEQLEAARINAPLPIFALDRVVSLQDYEDFARAFAGIGKSLATWTWKGQRRHVYLTVAGSEGAPVESSTPTFSNLLNAISKAGNPRVAVTLMSYIPAYFQVVADLKIDPAYLPENVLADVESRLREAFSFKARSFGQPVSYSEVVSCIQLTSGVVAVDINYLHRSSEAKSLKYLLESRMPGPDDEVVTAAELLMLDERPVELKIIS